MRVKISDLREGAITPLDGVILIRLGREVYTYRDECPHAYCTLLTAGVVEGQTLICTCHYCKFDIPTGRSLTPELTTEPLSRVPVRIVGDEVVVGE